MDAEGAGSAGTLIFVPMCLSGGSPPSASEAEEPGEMNGVYQAVTSA